MVVYNPARQTYQCLSDPSHRTILPSSRISHRRSSHNPNKPQGQGRSVGSYAHLPAAHRGATLAHAYILQYS